MYKRFQCVLVIFSKVFSGKRELSKTQIEALRDKLGISADLLL